MLLKPIAVPYVVQGVDLRELIEPMWRALTSHPLCSSAKKTKKPPEVAFMRASRSYRGTAWWSRHYCIVRTSMSSLCDRARAEETLLHELCHIAAPSNEGHGRIFKKILRDTANKLWGLDVKPEDEKVRDENGKARRGRYFVDDVIVAAYRRKLGAPAQRNSWMPTPKVPVVVPTPEGPKVVQLEVAKPDPLPPLRPSERVEIGWDVPRVLGSATLSSLAIGTKVKGVFGQQAWTYIRVKGGFVPESSPSSTPYDCVTFSNLPDRFCLPVAMEGVGGIQ